MRCSLKSPGSAPAARDALPSPKKAKPRRDEHGGVFLDTGPKGYFLRRSCFGAFASPFAEFPEAKATPKMENARRPCARTFLPFMVMSSAAMATPKREVAETVVPSSSVTVAVLVKQRASFLRNERMKGGGAGLLNRLFDRLFGFYRLALAENNIGLQVDFRVEQLFRHADG